MWLCYGSGRLPQLTSIQSCSTEPPFVLGLTHFLPLVQGPPQSSLGVYYDSSRLAALSQLLPAGPFKLLPPKSTQTATSLSNRIQNTFITKSFLLPLACLPSISAEVHSSNHPHHLKARSHHLTAFLLGWMMSESSSPSPTSIYPITREEADYILSPSQNWSHLAEREEPCPTLPYQGPGLRNSSLDFSTQPLTVTPGLLSLPHHLPLPLPKSSVCSKIAVTLKGLYHDQR